MIREAVSDGYCSGNSCIMYVGFILELLVCMCFSYRSTVVKHPIMCRFHIPTRVGRRNTFNASSSEEEAGNPEDVDFDVGSEKTSVWFKRTSLIKVVYRVVFATTYHDLTRESVFRTMCNWCRMEEAQMLSLSLIAIISSFRLHINRVFSSI